MLTRREFLNFSAATIALTSLPNQIQSNQLIRNYKLTAEITPHLFDKKGVLDSLWLYNKQSPGPVIEAKEKDIIRVEFVNNLNEASTIHWHGIKNINKMDGVPYLTQEPVQPGETYIYMNFQLIMQERFGTMHILKLGNKYQKVYMGLL